MAGTAKRMIAKDDWEKLLDTINIRKEDIHRVVTDLFVTEGYDSTAATFHQESSTDTEVHLDSIATRSVVRRSLHSVQLKDALGILSLYYFDVLEKYPNPIFYLRQQCTIELIRSGNVGEAVAYSKEYLAPLSVGNFKLQEEVQRTLYLLAFENPSDCPERAYMDRSRVLNLANDVNRRILHNEGRLIADPKLLLLLKELTSVQSKLAGLITFPSMDMVSFALKDPATKRCKSLLP